MHRKTLLTGLLLTVAAAIGFVAAQGAEEAPLDRRRELVAPEFIDVSGMEYSVEMKGEDRDTVEVAIYTTEPKRVRIDELSDRLRITVRSRPGNLFSRAPQGRIELRVPRDTVARLSTASGPVVVVDVNESRSLEIGSAAGAVVVRNSSGTLDLDTASGSVLVTRTHGEKNIDTASGNITVRACDGPIVADTASGAQSYEEIVGDIEADAVSGSITLSGTRGKLAVRTTSGRIRGGAVLLSDSSTFQSVSGSIHVDLANDLAQIRFDSESQSGQVRIGDSVGKSLQLGEGSIVVESETTSGNQTFE
jgi:hypothetical protein